MAMCTATGAKRNPVWPFEAYCADVDYAFNSQKRHPDADESKINSVDGGG